MTLVQPSQSSKHSPTRAARTRGRDAKCRFTELPLTQTPCQ
jgi:hypothetical protein